MGNITAPAKVAIYSLLPTQSVRYENGELVWTDQGRPHEVAGRLNEDEIVFIIEPKDDEERYSIYSLTEAEGDSSSPFKLSITQVLTLPQELSQHRISHPPDRLVSSSSKQLHVVISTKSGVGRAEEFWHHVLQPVLAALGLRDKLSQTSPEAEPNEDQGYQVLHTQTPNSVRDFSQGLRDNNLQNNTIILLSGDGGIVDLLTGIDKTEGQALNNTVAILPLGTGNALFHSVHKSRYLANNNSGPSSFVLGLRTLLRGATATLPTFKASFSPGSRRVTYTGPSGSTAPAETNPESLREHTENISYLLGSIVASYGLHASLVWESDTPEYRKHGAKRFGMAAQELLKLGHSYNVRVEARLAGSPAKWIELNPGERFNYVVATLVSSLEKTFTISPASRPLDGQLRLIHFGDVGGERTMQIMTAVYQEGSHVAMVWGGQDGKPEQRVGYEAIEALRVSILEDDPRWRKVCIDGTIVEIPQGGWMEVEKVEQSQLKLFTDRY